VLAEPVAATELALARVLAPVQVLERAPARALVPVRGSATAWWAPDCRCRMQRRTQGSEWLGRHTGRAFYAA